MIATTKELAPHTTSSDFPNKMFQIIKLLFSSLPRGCYIIRLMYMKNNITFLVLRPLPEIYGRILF